MALAWNDKDVEKQLLEVISDDKCTSFVAQYLRENKDKISEMSARRTKLGMSISDLIKTGVAIPNSKCGLYAADAESYDVFQDVTTYVVNGHNLRAFDTVCAKQGPPSKFEPLTVKLSDDAAARVKSSRCRFARNLEGYAFPTGLSKEARLQVEGDLIGALTAMTGDLAGSYQKMCDIPQETRNVMIKDHQLFGNTDEYLEKGGFYREWPEARGVYMNSDKTIIIWANEEDHLRVTSLESGANINSVYNKANRVLEHLQTWSNGKLQLAYREEFGWLAACPTNVGTGMRASVHIDLPNLKAKMSIDDIKKQCKEWNLDIRGIYGENTGFDGTVFDVSNRRRFEIPQEVAIMDVISGLDRLVALDIELSK